MEAMANGSTDRRLDDFREEVNRRFDEVTGDMNQRFAEVDKDFAVVDRRFDKVDHELHRINDRLDGKNGTYGYASIRSTDPVLRNTSPPDRTTRRHRSRRGGPGRPRMR